MHVHQTCSADSDFDHNFLYQLSPGSIDDAHASNLLCRLWFWSKLLISTISREHRWCTCIKLAPLVYRASQSEAILQVQGAHMMHVHQTCSTGLTWGQPIRGNLALQTEQNVCCLNLCIYCFIHSNEVDMIQQECAVFLEIVVIWIQHSRGSRWMKIWNFRWWWFIGNLVSPSCP